MAPNVEGIAPNVEGIAPNVEGIVPNVESIAPNWGHSKTFHIRETYLTKYLSPSGVLTASQPAGRAMKH